jgi:hypothetical protein
MNQNKTEIELKEKKDNNTNETTEIKETNKETNNTKNEETNENEEKENFEKENFLSEKDSKGELEDEELNKILLNPKINYVGHILFSFFYQINNINFFIVRF